MNFSVHLNENENRYCFTASDNTSRYSYSSYGPIFKFLFSDFRIEKNMEFILDNNFFLHFLWFLPLHFLYCAND